MALLWLGYNTDLGYFMSAEFPCQYHEFDPRRQGLFPDAGRLVCFLNDLRTGKTAVSLDHGPSGVDVIVRSHGIGFFRDPIASTRLYALYYGANYLAIVLVLLAIVLVEDPLPDLRKVLKFTWIVGMIITLGLLGAIPFLGAEVIS